MPRFLCMVSIITNVKLRQPHTYLKDNCLLNLEDPGNSFERLDDAWYRMVNNDLIMRKKLQEAKSLRVIDGK